MMERNGTQGSLRDESEVEVQVEEQLVPCQEGKGEQSAADQPCVGEGRKWSQVGSGDGGRGEGEDWGSFLEERDGQSVIEDGLGAPSRASPVQSAEVGTPAMLSNLTATAERPREWGLAWAGRGRTTAL